MKMIRKSEVQAHEDRIKHLNDQHQALLDSLTPPQHYELIKNTDTAARDLGNGVISMPGDFFTKDGLNFAADEVKRDFESV